MSIGPGEGLLFYLRIYLFMRVIPLDVMDHVKKRNNSPNRVQDQKRPGHYPGRVDDQKQAAKEVRRIVGKIVGF